MKRIALLVVAVLLALAGVAQAVTPAVPVESTGPAPTLPTFSGHAAVAHRVPGAGVAWQDPFMAPNPRNSVHNDAWASDDYTARSGPLGRHLTTFSTAIGRDCITLAFNHQGQIIGTCTDLNHGPGLYLLDPTTLDTLAFLQLPFVPPPAGTNPATNTTGGAYFYLDNHDRVVVAASNRRILVIALVHHGSTPAFQQVADYDPTPCLTGGDRMPSVLPDTQGRLWFVGRYHGAVGVLNPKTGKCRSVILHEEIENSFAVGRDGAYVVTDKAMYKFRARPGAAPKVVWKSRYRNSGKQKVGQFNAGSGTTPTLIGGPHARPKTATPTYVAITDNADPMNVVVYRAADRVGRRQHRVVCQVPVFAKGASDTENSLISIGRSVIVENNHGYDVTKFNDIIAGGVKIPGGNLGALSSPGMDRIDINRSGSGCHIVWRNTTIRAPSVVSKGDAANGLIYTYVKPRDAGQPGAAVWAWAAVDYRTGKVVWQRIAGHGGLYNNHYAGIALSPKGKPTLYLGGVGGIVALRDG
jgi:hypothetical protein